MCMKLPFGTFSPFGHEIASRRMRESATDPSQPAKMNMKSPFLSLIPRTFVATLPFYILYMVDQLSSRSPLCT